MRRRKLVDLFAFAILVLWPFAFRTEGAFRLGGMVLEVVGLWTVASGLLETRRRFGLPPVTASATSLWHRLKNFVQRRPRITGEIHVGTAAVQAKANDLHALRWSKAGDDAAIELRLKIAESNLDALREQVLFTSRTTKKAIRELATNLGRESEAQRHGLNEIKDLVRGEAIGGLRLEAFGLACLIASAIIGGIGPSLAEFIGPQRTPAVVDSGSGAEPG